MLSSERRVESYKYQLRVLEECRVELERRAKLAIEEFSAEESGQPVERSSGPVCQTLCDEVAVLSLAKALACSQNL